MNDTNDNSTLAQITLTATGALEIRTVAQAQALARMVIKAKMAPSGMETEEQLTLGLIHAATVGLPPMFAIQHMSVIGGRVALDGQAALAVVEASGLLEEMEEWIDGAGDARTAYCKVKRKGRVERITAFSVADAKRAGLWDERAQVTRRRRDGSGTYTVANDSPWFCYQPRMLQMRARGFRLRDSFADKLGGLWLREELLGPVIEGETSPPSLIPPEPPPEAQEPPPPPAGPETPPEPPSPPAGQPEAQDGAGEPVLWDDPPRGFDHGEARP